MPPVAYVVDGASGILDVSRQVKMRLKAFSYVYRMTNDTKWVDRAWSELQVGYLLVVVADSVILTSAILRMPPALDRPATSGILSISLMLLK